MIPQNFIVDDGGTTFGCPPVRFTSSAAFRDIIEETQRETQRTWFEITERNNGIDKSIQQADNDVISTQCVLPAEIIIAVMGHILVKCYETTQNPPIGTDFRRLGLYSLNQ